MNAQEALEEPATDPALQDPAKDPAFQDPAPPATEDETGCEDETEMTCGLRSDTFGLWILENSPSSSRTTRWVQQTRVIGCSPYDDWNACFAKKDNIWNATGAAW